MRCGFRYAFVLLSAGIVDPGSRIGRCFIGRTGVLQIPISSSPLKPLELLPFDPLCLTFNLIELRFQIEDQRLSFSSGDQIDADFLFLSFVLESTASILAERGQPRVKATNFIVRCVPLEIHRWRGFSVMDTLSLLHLVHSISCIK